MYRALPRHAAALYTGSTTLVRRSSCRRQFPPL